MKVIKGIMILILLICSYLLYAGNYYEVFTKTIRGGKVVFQIENYHDKAISCTVTGFKDNIIVQGNYVSNWHLKPENLNVSCKILQD